MNVPCRTNLIPVEDVISLEMLLEVLVENASENVTVKYVKLKDCCCLTVAGCILGVGQT